MIRQRVGSSPEMPYPGVALPGLQMEPLFMTSDDGRLAAELAERAGTLLLGLRAEGGEPGDLRKAGDRLSHEFLTAELAQGEGGLLPGAEYPVWSPYEAHDAAATLTQYLQEQKQPR